MNQLSSNPPSDTQWRDVSLEESTDGDPRRRASTNASNLSQLESSWEEVNTSHVPAMLFPGGKSRSSSRSRDRTKKKFKLKFANFFGRHEHHGAPAAEGASSSAISTEEKKEPRAEDVFYESLTEERADDILEGTNKVAVDFLKEAQQDIVSSNTSFPSPLQSTSVAHRFRLTASESEAKTGRTTAQALSLGMPRGRSTSLIMTTMPGKKTATASPLISKKDLIAKKNKRVLSNRSIGIVGGEDFIMNPTKSDKFVSYLHTQWNNVRYGFNVKPKVHLSMKSPIWLLGHCYTVGNDGSDEEKFRLHDEFLADFNSRIWFTYRRAFPLLAGSSLTSDCGWGCMLRSGQMMLAQALVVHFLGRDWRWNAKDNGRRDKDAFHRQLIRWCGDNHHHDQLFGLHKLVTVGQKNGKRAGQWYGPASLAFMLQKAMIMARPANPLLRRMHVYVSRDSTIFKGDAVELLKDNGCDGDPALIILIPIRLGTEKINPLYIPCMKDLLTLKYSIGVIGGRPSHSLYFVGWQNNDFITLDPHFCQETVDVTERTFNLSSFHCPAPQKLQISRMDPSCTLGFYCKNVTEFDEFCQTATEIQSIHCKGFPVFTFSEGRLLDYEHGELDLQSFEVDEKSFTAGGAESDYVVL